MKFGILSRLLFLLTLLLFFVGCTSVHMKGTPFLSGEHEKRLGPAEDRINLWPLVYYRDPALSVLWPVFELSDEHFAARPVFSVYGTNASTREYNIVWPWAQIRPGRDSWAFPAFWGRDYAVVFPLYWHYGNPFSERGGTDALIPLWALDKGNTGFDLHLLPPVFHLKQRTYGTGWRFWPLVGHYSSPHDTYDFFCWPLGYRSAYKKERTLAHGFIPAYSWYSDPGEKLLLSIPFSFRSLSDGTGWNFVPPLYYSRTTEHKSAVFTPVYMGGRSKDKADSWQCIPPLLTYHSSGKSHSRWFTPVGATWKSPDRSTWAVFPLLTGGSSDHNSSSTWILGPIAHRSSTTNSSNHHLFPAYAFSSRGDAWDFYSIPWSSGNNGEGSSWQLIPPAFFRRQTPKSSILLTPLFSSGKNSTAQGSEESWHAVVPLYFSSSNPNGRTFATLAGGCRSDANGNKWIIYPLLSGGSSDTNSSDLWIAAPLFHARRDKTGNSHHLLPLYYWDGRNDIFASPLAAQWQGSNGARYTLIPPLLSALRQGTDESSLWTAGGLARCSWGQNAGPSYIVPLFFSDPKDGTFVSPLVARLRTSADATTWIAPPLLSWMTSSRKRNDLWMLGPFAHASWGENPGPSHVFPLYYREPDKDVFISPLYASWKENGRTVHAIPPLLADYETDGNVRSVNAFLGLFNQTWHASSAGSSGQFIPLYIYDGKKQFYTPVVGWNLEGNSHFTYFLTPLVGTRTGDKSGFWVFPLISHSRNNANDSYDGSFLLYTGHYWKDARDSGSALIPFYYYNKTRPAKDRTGRTVPGLPERTDFWCLPYCWYSTSTADTGDRQTTTNRPSVQLSNSSNGCFPLWSYSSTWKTDGSMEKTDSSFLLLLYDYKHTSRSVQLESKKEDYVRSRVLWRLWHYERSDDDVTLDIFPTITYDRRNDGFRKFSFLWRFVRYENGPDGAKFDFLFIPFYRSGKPAARPSK